MRLRCTAFIFIISLGLAFAQPAAAQDEGSTLIAVGEMAPDFSLPGATRYGILQGSGPLVGFEGRGGGTGVLLQSANAWLNDPNGSVP